METNCKTQTTATIQEKKSVQQSEMATATEETQPESIPDPPVSQTNVKSFPWQMRALQHPHLLLQVWGQ